MLSEDICYDYLLKRTVLYRLRIYFFKNAIRRRYVVDCLKCRYHNYEI